MLCYFMFNWYCFIYLGCDLCYAIICLTGIVLSIQVVIYAILFPFNFMFNWYYFIYLGCYLCYAILCLTGIVFIYPGCDLCYAISCLTGIVLSIQVVIYIMLFYV